jgi:hypothetical protein
MRVICSVHPRYLGKRKPTSNYRCCNVMWTMTNSKEAVERGGYTSLFGYEDHSYMRIISEPKKTIDCTYCNEPFSQNNREKTCPECVLEDKIWREEQRESRMQK